LGTHRIDRCFTGLFLSSSLLFGQPSLLDLHLTSGGKPVTGRVYIVGGGGRPQTIQGAATYSKGAEEHSLVREGARIVLSPGEYRIRVEKGPEYEPFAQKIFLNFGETRRLDAEIPRIVNLNAEGWYSGDMHIHRPAKDMADILRAEDLNIGPDITRHVGSGRKVPDPYPAEEFVRVDDTHVVSLHAQEVERNFLGHGAAILLNTTHPLDETISLLFPTVATLCRRAKAEGGYIDAEKPIWKHVPIGVALGVIDSIGVVNNHFHPHEVALDVERIGTIPRDKAAYLTPAGFAEWVMSLYYSYLNCGFRLPASAGSASGVMPSWPGYERVYVHLTGPFSYAQWFKDMKTGHTFATNGPLLRVMANGAAPGAEVEWHAGAIAALDIRIDSREPLERAEVLVNGEVVKTLRLGGRHSEHAALTVPIPKPGWLVVRCFASAPDTIVYAHTSPFYFTHNGELPVRVADARRWAEFLRNLAVETDPKLYPGPEEHRQAIAEMNQAEAVYRRLMGKGESQ
jgi:hypothetical protein